MGALTGAKKGAAIGGRWGRDRSRRSYRQEGDTPGARDQAQFQAELARDGFGQAESSDAGSSWKVAQGWAQVDPLPAGGLPCRPSDGQPLAGRNNAERVRRTRRRGGGNLVEHIDQAIR